MPEQKIVKNDDIAEGGGGDGSVDLSILLGSWINTWKDSGSITRFTLAESGGKYTIRATVAGAPELPETDVTPYSAAADSEVADGFGAFYDLDFLEMRFAAYYVKGLVVVSQYTSFKDDSGRHDYFNREFFFRA